MATGVSECAAVQGHARSPHGPGAHLGNRDRVVPIPAHGCFPAEECSSGSGGRRGCGGAAFRFTLNALPEGDAGLRSSPPSTTYIASDLIYELDNLSSFPGGAKCSDQSGAKSS